MVQTKALGHPLPYGKQIAGMHRIVIEYLCTTLTVIWEPCRSSLRLVSAAWAAAPDSPRKSQFPVDVAYGGGIGGLGVGVTLEGGDAQQRLKAFDRREVERQIGAAR